MHAERKKCVSAHVQVDALTLATQAAGIRVGFSCTATTGAAAPLTGGGFFPAAAAAPFLSEGKWCGDVTSQGRRVVGRGAEGEGMAHLRRGLAAEGSGGRRGRCRGPVTMEVRSNTPKIIIVIISPRRESPPSCRLEPLHPCPAPAKPYAGTYMYGLLRYSVDGTVRG